MTENQSSSSSKGEPRVADLDLLSKRVSVQLWILRGCDNKEPLFLKQDGCLACFNLEFDRVIGDLPFTDDKLVRVYTAGLKDQIAAPLRLLRPRTLQEAKLQARRLQEVQENDGSSLPPTQQVQEKASEHQQACGSLQEDWRATLTDGPNQTVRTSGDVDSRKTQDSCAAVSPTSGHHDSKVEVQELQEPRSPPSARSIVLALPALGPLEDEIVRERKRQLNRESARRSRIGMQQELEELQNMMDNIIRETSTLKKNLLDLSEDCLELSNLNNSIEKELIDKYGPEAIAETTCDESHSQGSNRLESSTDATDRS